MSYSREMNVDLGSVYLKSGRVAIFGLEELGNIDFHQREELEIDKIQGLRFQDDDVESIHIGQVFKSDFDYNDGYGNRVKVCGRFNDEYEITELIIRFYPNVTKAKKVGPFPLFGEENRICIIDPAYSELLLNLNEDIDDLESDCCDYEPVVILGNLEKKQVVGLIISTWSCLGDCYYPIYCFKNEEGQIVELIIKISEASEAEGIDDLTEEGFTYDQAMWEFFKRSFKWQGNEEHLIDKYLKLPNFFDPDILLKTNPVDYDISYEGYVLEALNIEWEKWERETILNDDDPTKNPIIGNTEEDD